MRKLNLLLLIALVVCSAGCKNETAEDGVHPRSTEPTATTTSGGGATAAGGQGLKVNPDYK